MHRLRALIWVVALCACAKTDTGEPPSRVGDLAGGQSGTESHVPPNTGAAAECEFDDVVDSEPLSSLDVVPPGSWLSANQAFDMVEGTREFVCPVADYDGGLGTGLIVSMAIQRNGGARWIKAEQPLNARAEDGTEYRICEGFELDVTVTVSVNGESVTLATQIRGIGYVDQIQGSWQLPVLNEVRFTLYPNGQGTIPLRVYDLSHSMFCWHRVRSSDPVSPTGDDASGLTSLTDGGVF